MKCHSLYHFRTKQISVLQCSKFAWADWTSCEICMRKFLSWNSWLRRILLTWRDFSFENLPNNCKYDCTLHTVFISKHMKYFEVRINSLQSLTVNLWYIYNANVWCKSIQLLYCFTSYLDWCVAKTVILPFLGIFWRLSVKLSQTCDVSFSFSFSFLLPSWRKDLSEIYHLAHLQFLLNFLWDFLQTVWLGNYH